MQRVNRTTVLSLMGFCVLGLSALAQEAPPQAPSAQPAAPASREAMAARRQAMQQLTADFSAAVKNSSLSAEDRQKAQSALTQLQPHGKGAPRDPQARQEAMRTVRQMSANPALRPEDRDLLAKDLAAIRPNRTRN